jgi:hypothetical protein
MKENNTIEEKVKELLKMTPKDERKVLSTMPQAVWGDIFTYLKESTTPTTDTTLKRKVNHRVSGKEWHLSSDAVKTQDERYCDNLSDVLKKIRKRMKKKVSTDYVYHVGNVKELLRFEPDLQVRFVNDDGFTYFEVWLNQQV